MKIFQGMEKLPETYQGGIVVLGNFDGVHRGHQIVLQKARDLASDESLPFGVMSFEPHPRAFFAPDKNLFRLSPPNIKPLLMEALGADYFQIYEFDKAFSSLSAREFVKKTLIDHLAVKRVVCGYDFHFGKGREGTPQLLSEFGEELGFKVDIVPVQKSDQQDRVYSSSSIREDLRQGDVISAAHDLGRWWTMRGEIISGEGQGRFLGFPTANISLDPSCEARPGIYAARLRFTAELQTKTFDGAAYIGSKPTLGDFAPRLEIFLFDFDEDIYGQDVLVEFIDYIREDQKFDSQKELEAKMADDCRIAAEILDKLKNETDPMLAYEMGSFFRVK